MIRVMHRVLAAGLVGVFAAFAVPPVAVAADGSGQRVPACRDGQVRTTVYGNRFGTGTYFTYLRFALRPGPGQQPCTLSGYPRVTLTTTSTPVTAAPHTPQGTTVTLTATTGATADLYWYERMDNQGEHCPTVVGITITPPGLTRAVHRSTQKPSVTICGPAGVDGVQQTD